MGEKAALILSSLPWESNYLPGEYWSVERPFVLKPALVERVTNIKLAIRFEMRHGFLPSLSHAWQLS